MTTELARIETKGARLPVVYETAIEALATCERIDECKDWANKADAIASYAKQAEDETLMNTALKIKGRAIRRCGELLKQIAPAKAGRPEIGGGVPPNSSQRNQAAKQAGLSRDQTKQALRVASVPQATFEAMVERPKPATVTELAERGKKAPAFDYLKGRDPADYNLSLHAKAALKEFVQETNGMDPVIAVRGALPVEYEPMRLNAEAGIAWLKRLLTELKGK